MQCKSNEMMDYEDSQIITNEVRIARARARAFSERII